jgi:hypothetical protein
MCVTIDGFGLVNGFLYHIYTPLEPQVITALLVISTIHKPIHAKSSPTCSVFNSRS